MQVWLVLGALVVTASLVAVLLVVVLRDRRRVHAELEAARREAADLREQVAGLASAEHADRAGRPAGTAEYVITDMGTTGPAEDDGTPVPGRIDGRLFADIVLRESLLRAAATTHGVRRVLAPETRNRVRFEMRRELKRARKERREELRAARRLLADRAREKQAGEQQPREHGPRPADGDAA